MVSLTLELIRMNELCGPFIKRFGYRFYLLRAIVRCYCYDDDFKLHFPFVDLETALVLSFGRCLVSLTKTVSK